MHFMSLKLKALTVVFITMWTLLSCKPKLENTNHRSLAHNQVFTNQSSASGIKVNPEKIKIVGVDQLNSQFLQNNYRYKNVTLVYRAENQKEVLAQLKNLQGFEQVDDYVNTEKELLVLGDQEQDALHLDSEDSSTVTTMLAVALGVSIGASPLLVKSLGAPAPRKNTALGDPPALSKRGNNTTAQKTESPVVQQAKSKPKGSAESPVARNQTVKQSPGAKPKNPAESSAGQRAQAQPQTQPKPKSSADPLTSTTLTPKPPRLELDDAHTTLLSKSLLDHNFEKPFSATIGGRKLEFDKGTPLGEGTFGQVYSVRIKVDGVETAPIAVKTSTFNAKNKEFSRQSSRTEDAALRELSDTGAVPKFYGRAENDSKSILLMEHIHFPQGEKFLWQQQGQNFVKAEQRAALELVTGLQTIHGKGRYHGDIKLDNIGARQDGGMLFLDFGTSRKITDATVNKSYAGTLDYRAPETFSSSSLYKKSKPEEADVFALGMSLFSFRKGKPEHDIGQLIGLRGQDPSIKPARTKQQMDDFLAQKKLDPQKNKDTVDLYQRLNKAGIEPPDSSGLAKWAQKEIAAEGDDMAKIIARMLDPDPSKRITLPQARQEILKLQQAQP